MPVLVPHSELENFIEREPNPLVVAHGEQTLLRLKVGDFLPLLKEVNIDVLKQIVFH